MKKKPKVVPFRRVRERKTDYRKRLKYLTRVLIDDDKIIELDR